MSLFSGKKVSGPLSGVAFTVNHLRECDVASSLRRGVATCTANGVSFLTWLASNPNDFCGRGTTTGDYASWTAHPLMFFVGYGTIFYSFTFGWKHTSSSTTILYGRSCRRRLLGTSTNVPCSFVENCLKSFFLEHVLWYLKKSNNYFTNQFLTVSSTFHTKLSGHRKQLLLQIKTTEN